MWNPFWGDSRIQTNNYVKAQWLNEIQSSLWLNSSSTLFSTLGYTKRNIPPAPTPTPLPLGKVEAESCIKLNNAINYFDPGASGGSVVGYIEGYLDGIMINNAPACNSITIRYSSPYSGIQDLWVNDVLVQKVNFPSTGSYYTYSDITVPVNIPVNSSIRLYWRDYDTSWNIDCVTFTQEGGQETKIEAESGTKYNGAANYPDEAASGGQVVAYLGTVGSAVEFNNVPAGNTLTLKYATINVGTLSLYINGIHARDISFTSNGVWTGSYATKVENISIPAGATVKLQNDSGDIYGVNFDYITVSNSGGTKIEAESGTKYNGAGNYPDEAASGGQVVAYLGTVGSAVEFNNVPAGNTLTLKYATINVGTLSLYINGIHARDISFTPNGVWTGTYATKVESISIPAGATVKLQNDSGDTYGVNIDYIQIN
jgi:hypothetical protein